MYNLYQSDHYDRSCDEKKISLTNAIPGDSDQGPDIVLRSDDGLVLRNLEEVLEDPRTLHVRWKNNKKKFKDGDRGIEKRSRIKSLLMPAMIFFFSWAFFSFTYLFRSFSQDSKSPESAIPYLKKKRKQIFVKIDQRDRARKNGPRPCNKFGTSVQVRYF